MRPEVRCAFDPAAIGLNSSGETKGCWNIFGAAPVAFLLASARTNQRQIADEERADPGRSAELVSADRNHICVGQRNLSSGLGTIGKEDTTCTAHYRSQLIERLENACFIVGMLNDDQRLLRTKCS